MLNEYRLLNNTNQCSQCCMKTAQDRRTNWNKPHWRKQRSTDLSPSMRRVSSPPLLSYSLAKTPDEIHSTSDSISPLYKTNGTQKGSLCPDETMRLIFYSGVPEFLITCTGNRCGMTIVNSCRRRVFRSGSYIPWMIWKSAFLFLCYIQAQELCHYIHEYSGVTWSSRTLL